MVPGILVTGIQPGATTRTAGIPYDGPIYTGYANLTPDQVVVNVQVALRDQGYYAGAVDGAMGPETRAALAAFQCRQWVSGYVGG